MIQLYYQIVHWDLRWTMNMSISEKTKSINNKIEQNKAQQNLDRQTAKISALSSGNVSKDVLLENEFVN